MINFGTRGRDVFDSPINKCVRVSVGNESDYSAGFPYFAHPEPMKHKFWGGTWSALLLSVSILFVWGGACMYHGSHWRSKESWRELLLSSHHVGPRD